MHKTIVNTTGDVTNLINHHEGKKETMLYHQCKQTPVENIQFEPQDM